MSIAAATPMMLRVANRLSCLAKLRLAPSDLPTVRILNSKHVNDSTVQYLNDLRVSVPDKWGQTTISGQTGTDHHFVEMVVCPRFLRDQKTTGPDDPPVGEWSGPVSWRKVLAPAVKP
jgi:hypothetical protein